MRLPNVLLNRNDAIWERMKEAAAGWAESSSPLPTAEESLERVCRIARAMLPEYCTLPKDASTFYSREFRSMIIRKREARPRFMHR